MPRWRIVLEYDGAEFAGWGVQPDLRTIQGVVEEALGRLLLHQVRISVSGRTDAGVHAEGQVASFVTEAERTPENVVRGLNGLLPEDVACLDAEVVSDDFDPRRQARTKLYRYTWLDRVTPSPLRRHRCWWVKRSLDVDAMAAAARLLEGTHDFTSFRSAGCDAPHPVRTVPGLVVRRVGDEVWLEATGHGFLRHMVRIIAGALVEVGLGRREPAWILDVLQERSRSAAGRTAPARGLTLVRVDYSLVSSPSPLESS